jgi:galactonate dehydratase
MSAMSGVDIALWDLKGTYQTIIQSESPGISADQSIGKKLKVPIFELLGGKVRNEVQVYCWIGGDRPADVETAAYVFPET